MTTLDAPNDLVPAPQDRGGRASVEHRLNVRRLNARAVALANALGRQPPWGLDWFGVSAQVRVAGVQWVDKSASCHYDLLASMHWRGVAGYLGLTYLGAEAALGGHHGVVLWEALPPAVALALLQDATDRLSKAPANTHLGPVRFQAMQDARALAGPLFAVRLSVTLEDGGEVNCLDWLVNADGVDPGNFSPLSVSPARNEMTWSQLAKWGGLPVPVAFELGWVDLPLSELRDLRNEDVLLPDCWWAQKAKSRVSVRVGSHGGSRLGYEGVLDEDNQHIRVKGLQKMEQNLPEETFSGGGLSDENDLDVNPATGGAPGAGSWNVGEFGDLPVRLTFDLGEHSLRLQELTTISAGYVFDLGLSPQGSVNLRVNGLRVGEGEIVEIDGRIGVAVTRIVPPRV